MVYTAIHRGRRLQTVVIWQAMLCFNQVAVPSQYPSDRIPIIVPDVTLKGT